MLSKLLYISVNYSAHSWISLHTTYLLNGQHPLMFGPLVISIDDEGRSRVSAGHLKQTALLARVRESPHICIAVQDQLPLWGRRSKVSPLSLFRFIFV